MHVVKDKGVFTHIEFYKGFYVHKKTGLAYFVLLFMKIEY